MIFDHIVMILRCLCLQYNAQDHRAGGPAQVIVEQPKTSNEANDIEKPKT